LFVDKEGAAAMSADRIERETFIEAPVERVWEIVTEPEHVGRWFSDAGAEIDLRPGGAMSMTWEEHGTVYGRVEAVERPRRFAVRWAAQMGSTELDAGKSTLVEFTLAPEREGTRLRVVESGFASLDMPDADRIAKADGNSEGWQIELGHLTEYVAHPAVMR
jgi:uncharacterized protein YndB with AHSA1/START domain